MLNLADVEYGVRVSEALRRLVDGSCVGNTTNYKIEKGGPMRAFVFACIAAAAVAVIGAVVLSGIQQSADNAFSTSAVRLGP